MILVRDTTQDQFCFSSVADMLTARLARLHCSHARGLFRPVENLNLKGDFRPEPSPPDDEWCLNLLLVPEEAAALYQH